MTMIQLNINADAMVNLFVLYSIFCKEISQLIIVNSYRMRTWKDLWL